MSKLLEIKDLYQRSIPRLNEQQVWENVLISISRYWKLSFREALLICVQNPSASTIATFSTWNKVKRSVIAGEKAIVTMLDENKLKYYFDISQTRGKPIEPKWILTAESADDIAGYFGFDSYTSYLKSRLENTFDGVYNDNIANTMYAKNLDKLLVSKYAIQSAMIITAARCGMDLPTYRFDNFENLLPPAIVEVGNMATKTAQSILYEIEKYIRRNGYEYTTRFSNEGHQNRVSGSGRSTLSENRNIWTDRYVTNGNESERNDGGRISDSVRFGDDERIGQADIQGDSRESETGGSERDGTLAEKSLESVSGSQSEPTGRTEHTVIEDWHGEDVSVNSASVPGSDVSEEFGTVGELTTEITDDVEDDVAETVVLNSEIKSLVEQSFDQLSFFPLEKQIEKKVEKEDFEIQEEPEAEVENVQPDENISLEKSEKEAVKTVFVQAFQPISRVMFMMIGTSHR